MATAALPEYGDENFKIPSAVLPSKDPRAKAAYESQLNTAKNYATGLKDQSDKLYNSAAGQARSQLPGLIQQNRASFNARGLLHSGKEAATEAGTVQGLNQQLAQKRSEINSGLAQNLRQLEGGAFGSASALAQPGAQTAQTELQGIGTQLQAIAGQNQMNSQLIGSVIGGGSSLAGAGLANAMQAQNNYGVTGGTLGGGYGSQAGADLSNLASKYYK